MIHLLLWFSVASAAPCEGVTLSSLLQTPESTVLVLGERRGSQPDLARADRLLLYLSERQVLSLAVDAVPVSAQRTLDAYADGQLRLSELHDALEWDDSRPFQPYVPILTASRLGVDVIAAGYEGGGPPSGRRFPVPPDYASTFADAMGDHPIPAELQDRFSRGRAWEDNRIAQAAQQSWSRDGVLVVLVDRSRVEGGYGVPWQLEALLPGVRVQRILLDDGGDPLCSGADQVWWPWWEPLIQGVSGGRSASKTE